MMAQDNCCSQRLLRLHGHQATLFPSPFFLITAHVQHILSLTAFHRTIVAHHREVATNSQKRRLSKTKISFWDFVCFSSSKFDSFKYSLVNFFPIVVLICAWLFHFITHSHFYWIFSFPLILFLLPTSLDFLQVSVAETGRGGPPREGCWLPAYTVLCSSC